MREEPSSPAPEQGGQAGGRSQGGPELHKIAEVTDRISALFPGNEMLIFSPVLLCIRSIPESCVCFNFCNY